MFTERNQTYRLVKTLMTGHHPISVSSLNVENLIAKLNEPDFLNYIKSFDIFCALETFTSSHSTSVHTLETIACFTPPPKNYPLRQGRKSGGVTVLVRKSLKQLLFLRVSNAIMII